MIKINNNFKLNVTLFLCLSFLIVTVPVQAGSAELILEKNLTSVKVGDVTVVKIQAMDSDGDAEDFTLQTSNLYTTVTSTTTSVSITGVTLGVEDISIISSSGLAKDITVRVYDPLILDDGQGLLIAYVDQFQWKWDDSGSDGDSDGRFTQPIIPGDSKYTGFYALGSHAAPNYNDPNGKHFSIIVKDKDDTDLLRPPNDYEHVWSDSGSGASSDGSFWRPIPPAGYVAMGLVAQSGYNKPSLDIVRTVAKHLTVQGMVGDTIWNDKGTGSSADFGSFKIIEPDNQASADGWAFLPTNTFTGAANHLAENANLEVANLLNIKLPVMESFEDNVEPKLTGYHSYSSIQPIFSKSIYVPFSLLGDPDHSLAWQVQNSPFYYVSRVERFQSLDFFDNKQGSQDVTKSITITTGYEETQRELFEVGLGITVSHSAGVDLKGISSKTTVTLTTTFRWETETSQTYSSSTEKSTQYIIPAGKFGEILQVTSSFLMSPGNGLSGWELPMASSGLKILEFPLDESEEEGNVLDEIPGITMVQALLTFIILVPISRKKL